jgi:TPR repeat protein
METCSGCGIAVSGVEVMYTPDAKVVCPKCFAATDAVAVPSSGPWKGFAIAGAVVGAVPFGLRMATVSSSSVNGEVVSFVYRDWIAVICGVIAVALGLVTLWMARGETLRKALAIGAGVGVLALGGLQIARGFGVFATPDSSSSSSTSFSIQTPPPKPVVDPKRPETCFDQDSCFDLGRKLEEKKDVDRAIVAYTRACEEKARGGCFNAGFLLGKREQPEKAHVQFQRGCDLGHIASCNEAALAYKLGTGAPKDLERARKMFDEGCTKDFALACTNLADFYANAIGVAADPKRAFELFAKGCDLKDEDAVIACDRAGGALYAGEGTKVDKLRAASYFEKGCELSPRYCYNLGVLLENGDGIPKDLAKARPLYEKACKAGKPDACNNLGHLLDDGLGGPKDKAAAKVLYQQACDAGVELGCKNLKAMK